jgi:N-acetylglutamate synthase-like GNAT family acetyltransferase
MIEVARTCDVDEIVQLMKLESNTVGFIPRPRVKLEVGLATFLIAKIDDEIVGYIHVSRDASKILQLMVKREFRRRGIGTELLQAARVLSGWCDRITLRCRENLGAGNAFWLARGFKEFGRVEGGRGRMKKIICYESRSLTPSECQTQGL